MKRGFIDETVISVTGGDGGNGIVSFLRERARPHGGPNGGNGGRGGNVLVVADRHVKTLLELSRRRRIVAVNGKHGEGSDRHGAGGVDTRILVPVGTRVLDADTGYLHADLLCDQDNTLLAAGGHGGFGNAHFKSSVNQAPRRCTAGETGEERRFRLELRLLANVGFLGLPNAGKSSLLRALSAAKPKVAAYPFTTLSPQLGVIDGGDGSTITIADVPGLIEGAAQGAGLGNRFLKHLMRTALLCHVVDMTTESPESDCRLVENELQNTDLPLIQKPRWLVLNKADMLSESAREACRKTMSQRFPEFSQTHVLSALTGEGVREFSIMLLKHHFR